MKNTSPAPVEEQPVEISATHPTRPQTRPPQPTLQELRQWVEEWSRENPHLTGRLERAAFLVLLRNVQEVAPNSYLVGAEDGLRDYAVVNGECECTDFQRHGVGHFCKHRLAVVFCERLGTKPLALES